MTDAEIEAAENAAGDRANKRCIEDGWDAETRSLMVAASRRYAVSPEIKFEQMRRRYIVTLPPNVSMSRASSTRFPSWF